MIHRIEFLAHIATLVLIPVGVLLVVFHVRMLGEMKRYHEKARMSLGSPRLWFAKTSKETVRTIRFVWSREHQVLRDEEFSALCELVRILYFLFVVIFVTSIVLYSMVVLHTLV